MRTLTSCVMLFLLSVSVSGQPQNELNTILELVYKNDPMLASFYTKKEIAATKISQQSNLPDPNVTLGLTNMPIGSFSFTQEPMTGKTISLSQALPFPGKLSIKEKLASLDVKIVEPELKEYKLSLEKKIKSLYWNTLLNKEKAGLTKDLITLVSGMQEIIATRYSLDEAPKQQLVSLQLELSLLEDKITMFNGNYNSTVSELQTLTGGQSLAIAGIFPELQIDKFNNLKEKVPEIVERENPAILKNKLGLEKATLGKSLAEKNYYPDFKVTLQYSQREKLASTGKDLDDFLSVLVGFNIPLNIGGKRDAAIEEAVLTRKYLQEQIGGIKQDITSKVLNNLESLTTISSRIKILEEGLLPQSEENLSSALSGVGTGVSDYLTVIDALEKIITVKFRYIDLQYEFFMAGTNLEYLLGIDLNGDYNE